MVAHLLAVALPVAVVAIAVTNFNYFAWHPILMVLAVRYHALLLFCALLCAFGGFVVIYDVKNENKKQHFTSYHGLLGVIAVCYTAVQVCAGVCLKYANKLRLPPGLTIPKFRLLHSLSGCLLYIFCITVLCLGMYSTWFMGKVHEYVWGVCMIAGIFMGMLGVGQLNHIVQRAMTQKPQRSKK